MNVQRFFAPTARDALRRVKEVLGADAIVLANRAVNGGVEILALPAEAAGLIAKAEESAPLERSPAPPSTPPYQSAPRAASPSLADEDDYTVSLSNNARQVAAQVPASLGARKAPSAAQPAPLAMDNLPFAARVAQAKAQAALKTKTAGAAPETVRARYETAAEASEMGRDEGMAVAPPRLAPRQSPARSASARQEMPREEELRTEENRQKAANLSPQVMEELKAIRAMIERQLAGFAWGEMARQAPARTQLLGEMLDSGFSTQLARRLVEALPAQCELAEGRSLIKNALSRELKVLGNDADLIDAGGVFALVGPTGVGKTTSTAKLAARCVVRHGAESLALLTTDRYRIGAHEQLRIYGRILGVPVHVVKDAADLRRTLGELRQRHMVLIDTAGVGQKDRMVAEQSALLTAAGGVKRLLLLNATSRGDTLDDVVSAYAGPDLSGCIVTKVDEAASLAPAVDVIIRNRLECAYVANGQRVPEDLHLANRAWLLVRALRRQGGDSANALQGDEAGLLMAAASALRSLGESRV